MAEETRTDECVGEFDENNVRGECQVCGGEMEHSATCEIGVLTRERDKLRATNEKLVEDLQEMDFTDSDREQWEQAHVEGWTAVINHPDSTPDERVDADGEPPFTAEELQAERARERGDYEYRLSWETLSFAAMMAHQDVIWENLTPEEWDGLPWEKSYRVSGEGDIHTERYELEGIHAQRYELEGFAEHHYQPCRNVRFERRLKRPDDTGWSEVREIMAAASPVADEGERTAWDEPMRVGPMGERITPVCPRCGGPGFIAEPEGDKSQPCPSCRGRQLPTVEQGLDAVEEADRLGRGAAEREFRRARAAHEAMTPVDEGAYITADVDGEHDAQQWAIRRIEAAAGEPMTYEIPENVIEQAGKMLFAMSTSPPHEWETIEDPGRDLWRHNAREWLSVCLTEWGVQVETLTPGEACRNPYCLPDTTHQRIVSRWEPKEKPDERP